jgi:hypothetical protein
VFTGKFDNKNGNTGSAGSNETSATSAPPAVQKTPDAETPTSATTPFDTDAT